MTFERSDVCIVACAELFRGDGEILASPMGLIPTLGAKLARLTFEPELMMTDGVAALVDADGKVEGRMPYTTVFDTLWGGHRHVLMGASQIDVFGNQNISCIGDHRQPKVQLLGVRGAPGNTISHATSYFVPQHNRRTFVPKVDVICGIGNDRAAALGSSGRFHSLRGVVSNLGVFDFNAQGRMRLASIHPGVGIEDIVASTGFELDIPENLPVTREPTAHEVETIRERLDPKGLARKEVPA